MYYNLTSVIKQRLLLELQDSFSRHPVYRKITPYIQNRFAFDQRPQYGIVVKSSSTNKVQLSADNYVGQINSHVMLAYVGEPTFPIEWVREDQIVVRDHGGVPTLPGVYYLEILKAPSSEHDLGYFVIDPLLTQTDEAVILFQSGVEYEGQLQQLPAAKTLRLYENGRFLLVEGVDYTADYATGALTFIRKFPRNATVTADYRYAVPSIGPIPFTWNSADFKTLPGIIMAFGKRSERGQKVAVVVYQDRVHTAEAYGGKFENSFDMDIISRDTIQLEEIVDQAYMYLESDKKPILALEGIEIVDISIGGESEDAADETGQLFYYMNTISIQIRADWEVHSPIPLVISRAEPTGLQQVQTPIYYAAFPLFASRNNDFERIT